MNEEREDKRSKDEDEEDEKTIRIAMSSRRPLRIDPEDWKVIAASEREEGDKVSATVRVREHKDGRRIVYGYSENEAGLLIPPKDDRPDDDATATAIVTVAAALADPKLGTDCLEDLKAEKI